MSAKHLSGWHIDTDEGIKIKDENNHTVLWTSHTHLRGRRTDAEVMQIARLAAAAPELLEALRNLVAVQPNLMANSAEIADARAAIAKAVSS